MRLELNLEEILPGDDCITIQSNPISRDCRKKPWVRFDSIRFSLWFWVVSRLDSRETKWEIQSFRCNVSQRVEEFIHFHTVAIFYSRLLQLAEAWKNAITHTKIFCTRAVWRWFILYGCISGPGFGWKHFYGLSIWSPYILSRGHRNSELILSFCDIPKLYLNIFLPQGGGSKIFI